MTGNSEQGEQGQWSEGGAQIRPGSDTRMLERYPSIKHPLFLITPSTVPSSELDLCGRTSTTSDSELA